MPTYTNMVRKIEPTLTQTQSVISSASGDVTIETPVTNDQRKIVKMKLTFKMKNSTGNLYLTDLMLQAGSVATGWVSHIHEILWTEEG
jgi:hypothetical protein